MTNPYQADGPGIITVEQLNMCMWGSLETPGCFQNENVVGTDEWFEREDWVAWLKRQSVVTQYQRHLPDVITISEGCDHDVHLIASAIGYEYRIQSTGAGTDGIPRQCTAGRGIGVNAVLAKNITGIISGGYFQSGAWRSYLCVGVSTSEWRAVKVCTAHLSLSTGDQRARQEVECQMLRDDILNPMPGHVIFAGDANMSTAGRHCAPSRFHGLKNLERTQADRDANPHDGLLHIYYSANGFWRQSCGWSYSVAHTDHEGFLLELGRSAPANRPGCWRVI